MEILLKWRMVWKFSDPENVAVVTTTSIVRGEDWIGLVCRDAVDGGWQFLPYSGAPDVSSASVVSLREIATLDASVVELSDLPMGWRAWRSSKDLQWERAADG